jgi:sterol desaturase/sphingolipid hydroxylase (fatty acid hydroxylase superfamily)
MAIDPARGPVLPGTLSALVWPAVLIVSIAGFWAALSAGISPPIALFGATVANLLLVALLEIVLPYERGWSLWRDRQAWNDIGHALLLEPGARLGTLMLTNLAALAGASLGEGGAGLWPETWPLVLQIALAVVILDGADYLKHRVYHNFGPAWRIHALHHSIDRLHVLKGARLHFTEALLRAVLVFGPIALLGAPPLVLLWLAALMNFVGNLGHSNIDTREPGWVHALFVTPAVHRLHHAVDHDLGRSNLSAITLVWDHLGGTFRHPHRHRLERVGIAEDPVPRGFLAQLAAPVTWSRLTHRG